MPLPDVLTLTQLNCAEESKRYQMGAERFRCGFLKKAQRANPGSTFEDVEKAFEEAAGGRQDVEKAFEDEGELLLQREKEGENEI